MHVGAIEPVVKLVEAGGEGGKGQDSDVFKAEVVQHLLTLQVSHPALREAIQEVMPPQPCSSACIYVMQRDISFTGCRFIHMHA